MWQTPIERSARRSDQDIVLFAAAAAVFLMVAAMSTAQLWLTVVGVCFSASIPGVILWVNFIGPAIRKRRMAKPYLVCFKLGQAGDAPEAQELPVPANSSVEIDLRVRCPIQYVEHEIVVSFDGPKNERPLIKHVRHQIVKRGLLKTAVQTRTKGTTLIITTPIT